MATAFGVGFADAVIILRPTKCAVSAVKVTDFRLFPLAMRSAASSASFDHCLFMWALDCETELIPICEHRANDKAGIKMAHIIITALVCLSTCGPAEIKVWDGDTVRIDGEAIRILNIDTPEIGDKARCDAEARLAEAAKRRLAELLSAGPVRVYRNGTDKYRRTLAVIRVNGEDVGNALVKDGLARIWSGRREPWCEQK